MEFCCDKLDIISDAGSKVYINLFYFFLIILYFRTDIPCLVKINVFKNMCHFSLIKIYIQNIFLRKKIT